MSPDHPPGLDLDRLRGLLDRERPGLVQGPLTGRLIEGGRSNLTYAVSDGTTKWVVRRPPLGHVLATAHDMKREHRVISALHPTDVPVPNPVLLCEDPANEAAPGSPFYVMEFVEGTPYRTADQLAPLGPERTRDAVLSLVDTLVELHAVDPAEVGLADFGRPEGFLDRQLRRWGKQLDASRNRDLAGIDELHATLGRRLPRSPAATVVHGDYRLDNVLMGEDDRIKAILDWEMSTLGDPLTDLGLLVMYSLPLGMPDSPVSTTAEAPGHPDPAELIARYAERSGRDVSAVSWYTAFAWFKLAVILEGIHYRYTQGQTVGRGFDRIGDLVPVFIQHGLTTLQDGIQEG
ncbi:aminoglycoside phosphotransferase (APT) family kinase protein [Streptomyces sp. SAI-208]|uniref:phosphotransferase family protein n=1 Tax=unclassified Streptomyces TaxID=2593676 RepID=UPI002476F8B1|nr:MULTISPECIES: phosphotransferase family protein [unclassified Streptomyces]MDH6552420.1 aminoglycoside phosphotransferase (APT) family kinase protein [Streptomyces sp. SAI-041]MDH6571507.1 aminoglycoside phosphotransferase (APT) family kinase protein [Streptomyces sp. SAI-117]MDH6583531.1 aminoglycoside phosphotransferase (APT) family kinase protein [Streptomyces sp. SAI-133]MDH6611185.1 aminoglycoside phosphotransferase (APT) family kinase protein [Streptomyces sp. SAI-208]